MRGQGQFQAKVYHDTEILNSHSEQQTARTIEKTLPITPHENILRRFERIIIRRIYGPVRQGREWRIRNNEEIDNIIRKKDIVRFVKARRISWIGHVERMEDSRIPKRVMKEKIYTKRRRGRPKVRWLDDVQEDLRAMGIEGWRGKAAGGQGLRRAVEPSVGGGGGFETVASSDGLTAVATFWDATQLSLTDRYQRFGRTCHLQIKAKVLFCSGDQACSFIRQEAIHLPSYIAFYTLRY
jgi:hypothetical protein